MRKIGIIGAGPAGMMAALIAKDENNEVTLFDTNKDLGKKLLMTGGGRCNLTNTALYNEFLNCVIRNKKFTYSSFSQFDNYKLIEFFNKNGLETSNQNDGRVFPKSEKASDVVSFFKKRLEENLVKLRLGTSIRKVYYDEKFYLTDNSNESYSFDYLIVATGGRSYPNTGSDGYGYELAKKLGHNIIKPRPVLVPIFIKDKLNVRALSLTEVRINMTSDTKNISIDGDIMLNSNFITGPGAFRASSFMVDEKINSLTIDFCKDITYNELDTKIIDLIKLNSRKSIENALKSLSQDSLLKLIFEKAGIEHTKIASEFSKEERKLLVDKMKNFDLVFDRFGSFESAIVTRGGVDVKEINPKNMESKLVENLFFVGEILDIDCLTGGYNLQMCFSTAYAAANFIKENSWLI